MVSKSAVEHSFTSIQNVPSPARQRSIASAVSTAFN